MQNRTFIILRNMNKKPEHIIDALAFCSFMKEYPETCKNVSLIGYMRFKLLTFKKTEVNL